MKNNSQSQWMWLDGRVLRPDESVLRKFLPGHIRGRGVFETMLCREGKIIFLKEHFKRVRRGLRVLGIEAPMSGTSFLRAMTDLLQKSRIKIGRMRLMIWTTGKIVKSGIVLAAYHPPSAGGWSVWLSPQPFEVKQGFSDVKSLDYGKFIKAGDAARHRGFDEALLFDPDGRLIEGSRTNVFIVKNHAVITPSLSCGCLNGITRRAVLRIVRDKKIPCAEKVLSQHDLDEAGEVFLTNSLIGIMPVVRIGKDKISRGRPGPLTRQIIKSYNKFSRKTG